MYCPSCGKSIPDSSKFCLHCGSSLSTPTDNANVPTEWEYHDYFRKWEPGEGGKYRLNDSENENTIRLHVWNQLQSVILPDIQQLQDKGWQPVTLIGPAAFSFNCKSFWTGDPYLEITEFRVKMRKPKQYVVSGEFRVEPLQFQADSHPAYENQIVELVRQGRSIEAIRIYRKHTRAGLKECKDFVDRIERNMRK